VEGWIQSAVIAVVISSLVTIAGWYATHRSERLLESARRQGKITDIQTALLADIRSTSHRFQLVEHDRHLDKVMRRIRNGQTDAGFTPFVPREPGSLLWPSVASEVHILPNEVIDAVVLFFSQLETIRCFVDDLRSEQFARLESAQKAAMLQDYVGMAGYLVLLAEEAEEALARSLGMEGADQ
jgi:hypothetical protein